MGKRSTSIILIILMMLQMLSPIGKAFAAENGIVLPPSNLVYVESTPDDGKLTWTSVVGATSYNVYSINDGQLVLIGNTKTTSYTLSNLPEGKYSYVLSSLNGENESGPSAPVGVEIIYPKMAAPATITYTIKNGNDIVLNWAESKYAETYNIYEISNDGQASFYKTTTTPSISITNLAEGSYSYAVSASNSLYEESNRSEIVTAEVVYPTMQAPTNASFTITNGNDVTLRWDAVNFATNYRIYEVIDGVEVLISTESTTTKKYTNKVAGQYVYKIYSYSDRFGQSSFGKELTVTVSPIEMAAPSSFTYKIQNANDIFLSWGTVQYADSYKIYRVIDGEKILQDTVTGTSFSYSNAPAGEYIYEVHSYSDRFGESEESKIVNLTVDAITMLPPANVTAQIKNGNDIGLDWDEVPNATSYKIYQVINGERILKKTVSVTTATLSNMAEDDYVFEVYSSSTRFGDSTEGKSVSLSLVHPTMEPPSNVIQTVKSATSFSLSWDTASYATSYKVYQVINGQKFLKSTVTNPTVSYNSMIPGEYTFEIYSYSSKFGESKIGTLLKFELTGQIMDAPKNFTHTVKNGNDIALKWDPVSYATSYKVYKIVEGQKVLQSTLSGTNVTYSNQSEGNYIYIVHSVSALLGESPEGTELQVELVHPKMEKPSSLTSRVQNGNDVVLTWNSVPFANNYNIYELIDGQEVLVTNVTGTSKTLSNVTEGEHFFIVRSFSDRFGESQEASGVSMNVVFPTMIAPENLTKSIINGNDIKLNWNAVPYATSYKIYQVIDNEKILKKTVTSLTNTFSNMPEGEYTYEVYSYSDRFGESLESSTVSHTLVFPVMQAPDNLTNNIINGNDIQLKWNTSLYATGYKIYQIEDGIKNLVATVTGTSKTFVNMPEGDYTYEVHSFSDRFGDSPESSRTNLTLVWPAVQPPVLQGSIINANNIKFTWKAVAWADEYRLYKTNGENKELVYKGKALTYTANNLSEDTHSYVITAISNRFGESQYSDMFSETIVYPEMEAPVASLRLLSETSARISWNLVTYANGYNIYELIDGKPVLIAEKVNNISYTVQNLSYANHEYYVTSYSNSFGESKPSEKVLAKLIVDTLPPVTNADADSTWKSASQTIQLTATDNETGVAKTLYSLNDGPFVEGTSISIDQEGVNELSFYSIDKVGNKEDVKTVEVKIDKTQPVTSTELPDGWAVTDVNVVLNASDVHSGIEKTFYSLNGSELTEGTTLTVSEEGVNTVSFYSVDNAGNKEEIQTVEVKVDKTAPETKSDAPSVWVMEAIVALTATDTQSGVSKTFYSLNGSEYTEGKILTVSEEGVNTVSFYSVDNAGNKEEVQSVEIKVDKAAPETKADAPSDWVQEAAVKLTATDEHSGVSKTFFSLNGTEFTEGTSLSVSEEGVNTVSFYTLDNAGNKEEVQTVEVKVDKTAPETKSDAPSDWVQEATVELKATEKQSGVSKTFYSLNGSEFTEGNTLTVSGEGVNIVSFYSIDNAGNKEEVQTVEVKVDKTAPETKSDAPSVWVKEAIVTLTATDTQSGVANTFYSLNGSEFTEGTNLTVSEEGVNTLSFYSVDKAGNKEEVQTVEVKVDKTAPETKSDAPTPWMTEAVTVNLTSTDAQSGIAKTYYFVKGSELLEGNSFTISEEGIHEIAYYSVDQAGNIEDIKTEQVKIDKTAPTISADFNAEYGLGSTLNLSYSAQDNLSGIVKEEIIFNGKSYKNGEAVTLYQPGEYKLSIRVTDAAGLTTIVEKTFVVYIPIQLDVLPRVIHGNKGIFGVLASLPKGYCETFDISTVTLNGVPFQTKNWGLQKLGEFGLFKFDREDFVWNPGYVELELRGKLSNGYLVVGKTSALVKR